MSARYEFLGRGTIYTSTADDAITAFHDIKHTDKDDYFRLKKFSPGQLPPDGYTLLDIGYGLSVAYKRIPEN